MGVGPINKDQIFTINAFKFFSPGRGEGPVTIKPALLTGDKLDIESNRVHFKTFIDEAIEKLRKAGGIFKSRVDFSVDEETDRIVVKVIDTETDKVIKEIPPEQLIKLAAKIQKIIGLLVDEKR